MNFVYGIHIQVVDKIVKSFCCVFDIKSVQCKFFKLELD